MRMKRDHMGNDQLLPGYNIQCAVCDGFIAAFDVYQYASDMDCFQPLMDRFQSLYGQYPEYPVADSGYGSYNNYLFSARIAAAVRTRKNAASARETGSSV